jgi:predicted transcriptional regulator
MEQVAVYRCRSCDELVLAPEDAPEKDCCGDGLESVKGGDKTPTETPEAEAVLNEVFGLGKTSLNVCFCVIEKDGATVSEVAEEMDIDRSAISRHVNRLVDAGILTKEERNLRQGGVVHVYEHEDPEVVKERLKLGSYLWITEVVELVSELNDEKMEVMADDEADVVETLGGKIWKES